MRGKGRGIYKGKGSLDSWLSLFIFTAKMEKAHFSTLLEETLLLSSPFKKQALTDSEQIFRKLSKLEIVNEDTKWQIAMTLEAILKEIARMGT